MNPEFPPGMAPHPLSSKQPDIGLRIHHFLKDGKLHTQERMNTFLAESNLLFLDYFQIKHYVTSI